MGVLAQCRTAKRPWRSLLAILCVLLLAVSATVQVGHTHPDGAVSHPDCSLCVTAHVVTQIVQSPAPAPVMAVHALLETSLPAVTPTALSTFALFTRPPPAADIVPV
jgi:hypothetical protein